MQVGVLDDVLTNVDNVIRKGRLGPGQTVVADLSSGTFKENTQIAKEVGSRAPYEEWLSSSTRLKDLNASGYSRECLMPSADVRPSSSLPILSMELSLLANGLLNYQACLLCSCHAQGTCYLNMCY